MAHEIDFSKGYAAMFSVRLPVWHQAETGAKILDNPPTVEEALVQGGLDYGVLKVPTLRQVGDRFIPNDLAFSTIRTDTGAELGMVGRDYTVLQNADALRVLQPLLDKGWAQIETAGALRGGADIWVAVSWDLNRFSELVRKVFLASPEQTILPYSVIRNNHSGRSNVVGLDTAIRVVCANTLGMALGQAGVQDGETREGRVATGAFAVPHRSNVLENVKAEADALWANRIAAFEILAQQYELLRRTILTPVAFERLVLAPIAPDPRLSPRFNPEARMAGAVLARAEAKRAELSRLWTNGAGHQGDHSAWEAYNGVVEALDHNKDLWPARGGVWRTQQLLDGSLADTKQQTINRLVRYAQAN